MTHSWPIKQHAFVIMFLYHYGELQQCKGLILTPPPQSSQERDGK